MTLKSVALSICSLLLISNLQATVTSSSDSTQPTKYELRLFRMPDAGISLNGYLGELNEQSITLIQTGANRSKPVLEIPVADIDRLKFRDKKSVGRGLLYGAGIGFGLGFIVGLASGGTSSCAPGSFCVRISPAQSGLMIGLLAILPGTVIGGTLGSLRINIPIKGQQTEYERQRETLLQYRYGRNF